MSKLTDLIQWQTVSGDQVTVDDVSLTPQSQALTIRWPSGGFVWNRPVAVVVEQGGQTERIPVVDVTRVAQLMLIGLSLIFWMVTLFWSLRQRRGQK